MDVYDDELSIPEKIDLSISFGTKELSLRFIKRRHKDNYVWYNVGASDEDGTLYTCSIFESNKQGLIALAKALGCYDSILNTANFRAVTDGLAEGRVYTFSALTYEENGYPAFKNPTPIESNVG